MEVFPEAKVILSVRDPENWYKSVKETVYQSNVNANSFPVYILYKICGMTNFTNMVEKIMRSDQNRLKSGLFDAISDGKEASIQFYNDWITKGDSE